MQFTANKYINNEPYEEDNQEVNLPPLSSNKIHQAF